MSTYFIITELEKGWSWKEFDIEGREYDYCTSVLDIPADAIEYIEVLDDSLEILLVQNSAFLAEVWYTRLSDLAKASEKITA